MQKHQQLLIKMQRDRPRLLERTLGSKTKIAVLRRMCVYPKLERTVTRLSDDVGLDKSLVSKVVKELEDDGVLHVDYKGNVKICRMNEENFVVKNLILPVFESERGIAAKISSKVLDVVKPRTFKTVIAVAIYGSFARGNFRPKSDVDLVVVVENLSEKKQMLVWRIPTHTGGDGPAPLNQALARRSPLPGKFLVDFLQFLDYRGS